MKEIGVGERIFRRIPKPVDNSPVWDCRFDVYLTQAANKPVLFRSRVRLTQVH